MLEKIRVLAAAALAVAFLALPARAAGGYRIGSVTKPAGAITQPGFQLGYGHDDNGKIARSAANGKWTGYP